MKKLIIALLAVAMLTMVACGNQEGVSDVSENATEATTKVTEKVTETTVDTTEKKTESDNKTATTAYTDSTKSALSDDVSLEEATEDSKKITETTEKKIIKPKKTTVKSDYFSLTLPANWNKQYTYDIIDNKHIFINHKKSVDAGYSGNLFSVEMFCSHEDYTYFPIYKYLNTIEAKDGEIYDVIAIYPTDTQCSEALLTDYTRFANQTESVIKSIKYTDDVKVVR